MESIKLYNTSHNDMVIKKALYKSLKTPVMNALRDYLRDPEATFVGVNSGVVVDDCNVMTISCNSRAVFTFIVDPMGIIKTIGIDNLAYTDEFGVFVKGSEYTINRFIKSFEGQSIWTCFENDKEEKT